MSNELAILETQLKPLAPSFAQVLGSLMPVERLLRTVITSAERNPDLLTKCNRQSLFNAAMTFAVLGLEVDGVTGQGYLIPFKGVVQPVIGYLGYNTLGARAGYTITGRVVREGDPFEFDESEGVVHHRRVLGGEVGSDSRRIIGAWAKAAALHRPSVVRVMSVDELLAVKAKSPRGDKPPWSDPEIGYPAMCEKTVKRRLRRDMPLTVYQSAAVMEETYEERQKAAWIHPEHGVIDQAGEVIAPNYNTDTPTAAQLLNPPTLEERARQAAEHGKAALREFCTSLKQSEYAKIKDYVVSLVSVAERADNEQ
jgi:recombination protein RecT